MEANTGAPAAEGAAVVPSAAETAAENVTTPKGGAEVNPTAEQKDAAREAIRKYKLKVDGEEVEVDEDELKRGYTHQRAANKKMQEGLKAKKQAEAFITMMKDPSQVKTVMEQLGYTRQQIRDMSEKVLAAELEDELMDPREKEMREYKNKLKAYEDLENKQKEEVERKRDHELKKKYSEEYSTKFIEALKETSLPPTKGMVAEMAKYIKRAADLNFEMTPQEAAKLVREDVESSYRNLYGEADAETLVKMIGDQGVQKIRGYDVAKLKDPNTGLKTPEHQGERRTKPKDGRSYEQKARDWARLKRGV